MLRCFVNVSRCPDFLLVWDGYHPPPLRRHIAVTLPEPRLEAVHAPTYACIHIPGGKRLPRTRPGSTRPRVSAYRRCTADSPGAEPQEASAMSVETEPAAPTIYDVARTAGVSIASV